MKGLFLLQRYFSRFGHGLALALRDEGLLDSACAYIYTRHAEGFLRSRTDLRYEPSLVDEDMYGLAAKETLDPARIDALERDYGLPHLWPYAYHDRTLYHSVPPLDYPGGSLFSHEDLLRHLQVRFRLIEAMLEEAKPDYVMMPVVGAMGSMVLYQAARKRGIPTVLFASARVGNRVTVLDNGYDDFSTLITPAFRELGEGRRESPRLDEARRFLEEMRSGGKRYEGFNPLPPRPPLPVWAGQSVVRFFKHLGTLRHASGEREWGMEDPWNYLRNRIRRNLRLWTGAYPRFDAPVGGERFVFVPLSQDPELTTLLWAPYATNPLAMVQYLAKSVPARMKLYVKDHPWMWGYRPASFYRELKSIPNVRLLDPRADSRPLVRSCSMVASVNGTAGWEGLCQGKPVITFGQAFYNAYPQVRRVKAPEDLPAVIHELLASYRLDEKALLDFICALCENTVQADYYTLWNQLSFDEMLSHPHLKVIASHAAERIRQAVSKRAAPAPR